MKIMRTILALISLTGFCLGAVWAEYRLVLHFGIVFSVATSASVLVWLLCSLLAAPEGCEEADGFHVQVRSKQMRHARHARPWQLTRVLKMDAARFLSSP
jgi:hypothetical protein